MKKKCFFLYLARLRGEVGFSRSEKPGEGASPHTLCSVFADRRAPHPNPLPAKCGARERREQARDEGEAFTPSRIRRPCTANERQSPPAQSFRRRPHRGPPW